MEESTMIKWKRSDSENSKAIHVTLNDSWYMIIFIIKKSKQINVTCLSVCCLKWVPTSTTCNWRQKESILPASPYREIEATPEGKSSPLRYTFPSRVPVSLSPLTIWGAQSQQACDFDPSAKCLKIQWAPAEQQRWSDFPVWHLDSQK